GSWFGVQLVACRVKRSRGFGWIGHPRSYSIVIAPLPVAIPPIWIGHRGVERAASVGATTAIGSEKFASIFTVRASDPAMVEALLDPSMPRVVALGRSRSALRGRGQHRVPDLR